MYIPTVFDLSRKVNKKGLAVLTLSLTAVFGVLATGVGASFFPASAEKALENCKETVRQTVVCSHTGGLNFADKYSYEIDYQQNEVAEYYKERNWHSTISDLKITQIDKYSTKMQEKFNQIKEKHLGDSFYSKTGNKALKDCHKIVTDSVACSYREGVFMSSEHRFTVDFNLGTVTERFREDTYTDVFTSSKANYIKNLPQDIQNKFTQIHKQHLGQ